MEQKFPGNDRQLEELKRISRILQIVQMISVSPKRFRRKDLGDRFEISERMIQKDLEVVRHGLKLDLCSSQKGYYFSETPRLPAVQYSLTEAIALLLAVQTAQAMPGAGSPELAAAVTRLEALLPSEFSPFVARLRIQAPMTAQGKHRQQMLMLLNRALVEERKVSMTYATRSRGGAVTQRVVRPYYLMPYVRSWQLVAHCELRSSVLMFKLDRILNATLLDERYRLPVDFDLDSYLGGGWGIIRGDAQPPEAIELLFEANTGHRVMEEDWHPSQEGEVMGDGRVKFTLRATITPEFVAWLLYYGSRVEVVQPGWLREQVAEEHREAVELYEEPESTPSIQMEV